jgi:uncharacterized RDD family membrane protein YckC
MSTMPPDPNAPDGGGYGGPPPPPPPPPGYGGAPQYGGGGWSGPPLAEWPDRALSFVIDYFGIAAVGWLVTRFNSLLGLLIYVVALVWGIYNANLAGQTGQSTGKKQNGTRLVSEATGQPIGSGAAIGRFFLHILDGLPCGLGFLWPLWDAKKQTFADKIMKTIVVKG